MLALDPSVVRMDAAEVGNTEGLRALMPALTSGGIRAASSNGVLGDPRVATADEGEALLAGLVADLRYQLARWAPDGRGRLT
jgi:creatinine amidohydrolase